LAVVIGAWIKVEMSREEQGIVESDPTVQESRFQQGGGGGGGGSDAAAGVLAGISHGPLKLFSTDAAAGGLFGSSPPVGLTS
jgi:hypothetical protein